MIADLGGAKVEYVALIVAESTNLIPLSRVPHAHAMLGFAFKTPLATFSQPSWERMDDQNVNYLILSIDAVGSSAHPVDFSLYQGLWNRFAAAYRLITPRKARAEWKALNLSGPAHEYVLDMDPEEAQSLLQHAVAWSHSKGYSVPYNSVAANCCSSLFDILDTFMANTGRPTPSSCTALLSRFIPGMALYALKHRGLYRSGAVLAR